jgi:histidine ammonia-lyase
VRLTGEALALLEQILSIEVLMANDVMGTAQTPASPLGTGTGALSATARTAVDGLGDDRSPAEVQRRLAAAMFDPPGRA